MDYHQSHGYIRAPPPPPSTAEPYQTPPPPLPPRPPTHPWPYPATQFQYQPQTKQSPSPPPPQWLPPQSSDNAPYYHFHQPPPYPAHPHYPPPHPLLPPRPPPASLSYSQDWESNWTHQQSRPYPTNNNEDWGAKAKAWLAAKAATENQNPSPQFVSGGGTEEKYQYFEQYSQSNDPHTSLASTSNYQQCPVAVGPPDQSGLCQLQESQYTIGGVSSYGADMHVAFSARDASHAGDALNSIKPIIHQQEVPSSYSSVAGNEGGDRYEKYSSSSPQSVAPFPHQHIQPLLPARAEWMEEPHSFGSLPTEIQSDLRDQPLNFAPQFTRNPDPHAPPQYNYSSGGSVRGGEPTVAISSNYAWPSSTAPEAAYPLVPLSIPLASQVDHPMVLPSPASGHPAPMFPTGPTFQTTVPTMGAAFGVGAGVTPPPTDFSGDAYGVSERPKKASVPNWLREEIIKNKAVIRSSTPEIPKDDSQSIEEDSYIDRSSRKGYQVDSKIDSSRSTEDEDEDEDELEAARTATINQEIKRVLTEVLLKVTDELFDEIATKVLKEGDLSVEVGCDVGLSNHQILPSTQSVSTPKTSAKILFPIKTKESDYGEASEKSTSVLPGDILGLASYASDEEDEDLESNTKANSTHQQPSSAKLDTDNFVNGNSSSMEATEEHRSFTTKVYSDSSGKNSQASAIPDGGVANMESSDYKEARELAFNDDGPSSKRLSRSSEYGFQHGPVISKMNNSLDKRAVERNEDHILDAGRVVNNDSKIQHTGGRFDKNDTLENKRSSFKDSESAKERLDKKGKEEYGRHLRSERMDYSNISIDKVKEKSRTDEKLKNSESRERLSPFGGKEGNTHNDKRASGKKDNDRREDRRRDEKRERPRRRVESESSRHKQRRSSSVGLRDRDIKDNFVINRAHESSDESSDDSTRKSHHSKRRKSPSPVRSRKRQVSRSPHSKHSKGRHFLYSYVDNTRGKGSASRSRSRSPVHRRR